MTHSHHQSAPSYHPSQILHDGCEECELRGRDLELWIGHVDSSNWARAWERAIEWNRGTAANVCAAEAPLLRQLSALAIGFISMGFPVALIEYVAADHSGWTVSRLNIILNAGRELGEVDAQARAVSERPADAVTLQPTPEMAAYLEAWPAGPGRSPERPTFKQWQAARAEIRGPEPHIEATLACGDTISLDSAPEIGQYRKCIHCDKRKRVMSVADHSRPQSTDSINSAPVG